MLLAKLAEYNRRRAPIPYAYKLVPVPWVVHLTRDGQLLPPMQRTSGRATRGGRDLGREFLVPCVMVPRANNPPAALLVDRADFALGFAGPDPNDKQRADANRHHALFLKLLGKCAQAAGEPTVRAVLHFLEGPENSPASLPPDLGPRDTVGFAVDGAYPQDLPEVRRFWAAYQAQATTGESGARCLVCGQDRPIARRHPKVKGIPGGRPGGLALVSADEAAYQSYGLEASLGAPVCLECAEAYTNGANALLQGETTSLRVREADTVYLFWTREGQSGIDAVLLGAPDPQRVQSLLDSAWKGRESPLKARDLEAFYATALSASGGRVVVRDWIETTLGQARRQLARYFLLQRLPGQEPMGLDRLRQGLLPPRSSRTAQQQEKALANVTRWLVRCALLGEPLPEGLLYQAARRNRAEQGPGVRDRQRRIISWARASLIKMVFLSPLADSAIDEEGEMTPEHKQTPAYLCGRLLALLEQAQGLAIGNPNATLVDRFYGAASSAPASVFGLLMRNAQHHLSSLRREQKGTYNWLQQELGEIAQRLSEFPRTLTLRDQGLFALGYYYQRQERFRRRDSAGDETGVPDDTTDT